MQTIHQVDIVSEMKKSYLDYSMSVIIGRALPDVRDGLKPVHRRIMYTMNENSLYPDKPYRKCADTVGSVLGRYHPHGDAAVYDAMVRMAQDFSLRYPLVDGHGNFGSVDGDPAAAYRYTESRMSKLSMELLADIDKDTVDFVSNYDDRLREPSVLPSRFPNLLVNGSDGIAVGMATNIPPHNLKEVCDGICYLIDNPDAELADLMEFVKGPDFPTGGIVMGRAGIRAAYATGRGKIILRSKAEIEEDKSGKFKIVVTEIPYQVNKARLIQSIAELIKNKRIEGISDLRDESDRDGLRVVIELKREANPQVVLNQLYSYTQLQITFGAIMLAICDGQPKVLSLKEMMNYYIDFQKEVIVRRTKFDLKKAQDRAHILEGYVIAQDNIDEVVSILRRSKSIPEGKEALMERFNLSDVQATAIVQMQLGRLTGMERNKIEEELAAIRKKIEELLAILNDENLVLAIIKEELTAISNKYGDERRTAIENISGEVDIEDLIPVENSVVTLTHFGYIKRIPADTYRTQGRSGRGVSGMTRREDDFVEEMFVASSHDYVLFITESGKMFRLRCFEIPESSRTAKGTNIVNLLPIENGERIAAMIHLSNLDDEDKYLVMATEKGIVKRTKLTQYRNIRKNGLIALNLREDDRLCAVRLTGGEDTLLIATRKGKAVRFNESDVRAMSRTATGVRGIRLRGDDNVVAFTVVKDGEYLVTITDKGYGKKCDPDQYRVQSRGGSGVINYRTDEKRGEVCGVRSVNDEDDLMMISDNGVIIRIRLSDINVSSRNTLGVRVMRVDEGCKVAAFANVEHDEEAETEQVEKLSEEELKAQELEAAAEDAKATAQADETPDDDEAEVEATEE
ncbi:MAG: DNA gyrase subunit A [Oscillospiraceae bacterium]|nr:DNA gyrase subunit A [Oscillospiraceae bacterium]